MNTIGQATQTRAAPPERQIGGAVTGRLSRRAIYFFVALMVFVFLCGAPLWIGVAWLGGTDGKIAPSISVIPAAMSAPPVVEQGPLGYTSAGDASAHCAPPATVSPIYRNRQTVGWTCVHSLD